MLFLFTERFKATTEALSVSGAGTKDKVKCPFFEELSEIFGHRPIVNQSGVDSTVLPPDLTISMIFECLSLYLIVVLLYYFNYKKYFTNTI